MLETNEFKPNLQSNNTFAMFGMTEERGIFLIDYASKVTEPDELDHVQLLTNIMEEVTNINELVFLVSAVFRIIGHEEGHQCERDQSSVTNLLKDLLKGHDSKEIADVITHISTNEEDEGKLEKLVEALANLHKNKTKPS